MKSRMASRPSSSEQPHRVGAPRRPPATGLSRVVEAVIRDTARGESAMGVQRVRARRRHCLDSRLDSPRSEVNDDA